VSYEVRLRKERNPKTFSRSFQSQEAKLTPEIIRQFGLAPALTRFGKALAKQFAGHKSHPEGERYEIIGVEINSIGFQFILDPKEKEEPTWR
jgi:hypothetical protein